VRRPATLARGFFAAAAACLATTGCALLSPPPKVTIEKSLLTEIPRELPQRTQRDVTILVLPPRTTPVYDTTQMAYRTQPHEVAYFSEREWAETPSQMLYPLVVRTLENTHAFRAVLTEQYGTRYTYALRTEILELLQDFASGSASLSLTLRFQLSDYQAKTAVATREVSVRMPMHERNSYAGVLAANEATADALRQMAEYVLQATDAPAEERPRRAASF
jgi:cholesterol transport system auxiliary component